MFLYKTEVQLADHTISIIVIAESDEKAFAYAESHLIRHFVVNPEVKSLTIVEKKRVEKGSGYVIEASVNS